MKDPWLAVRFAMVGTGVAVYYVLVYPGLRHAGLGALSANLLAFLSATAIQYVGQTSWTFRRPLGVPSQIARFATMIGIGLGLSALITSLIAPALSLAHWQAAAIVMVIVPISNFILMKLWVYQIEQHSG